MTYSTTTAPALVGGAQLRHVGGEAAARAVISDLLDSTETSYDPVTLAARRRAEAFLAGTRAAPSFQRDAVPPTWDIPGLNRWAQQLMTMREPDFVIGDNYLRRWYVVPRNLFSNVYLHEIRKSDDDRALHDHPWRNTSIVLAGEYIEHQPGGVTIRRRAGDVIEREAEALHRLEIDPGAPPVLTLFMTGPKVRDWGFACPQGWVPWQVFTDPTDSSKIGAGCGEP